MTSEEISALAKTHTDAIFAQKLTKAEVIMLLAVIDARVKNVLFGTGTPTAPVKADVAPKPIGSKIANAGYPCVCVSCSKHIYTVNKDIHENESVDSFVSAFTPMPGFPAITKKIKISNVDNNITTNCPDCGGEFTLYLAGKQI